VQVLDGNISYEEYGRRSQIIEKKSIVLDTIRKSGTNYLRSLIANFLAIHFENRCTRVSYDVMHNELFPNIRDFVLFPEKYDKQGVRTGYVYPAVDHVIRKSGYSDFLYGHDNFEYYTHSCASKIIHLYRNPLDMAVSYYYFSS